MYIYSMIVVLMFGLVFGSFLNCAAMRYVRKEDFIRGHSRCRSCGHELTPLDLIPVIGWLSTGGHCRHCKEKISIRYPLTELLFAGLWIGLWMRCGWSVLFFRDAALTGCLFALSLVDLESHEIPDGCLVFGLAAWLLSAPFICCDLKEALLSILSGLLCGAAMLLLSLIMDRVLGRESLGGGDIKLFALLGIYMGGWGSYFLVLLSSVIGLLMAAGMRRKGGAIPFGPAIALAGYLLLLYKDAIVGWYLGFL